MPLLLTLLMATLPLPKTKPPEIALATPPSACFPAEGTHREFTPCDWESLPRHALRAPGPEDAALAEGGYFQLRADEDGLFIRAVLEDREIVATGLADELPHYELGDTVEVFVATPGAEVYWELYATPAGKKTTLFFPRYREPGDDPALRETLLVRAERTERGWNAYFRIPRAALHGDGRPPTLDGWRLLVARYNYTEWPGEAELSAFPRLPEKNFHLLGDYARLKETDVTIIQIQ